MGTTQVGNLEIDRGGHELFLLHLAALRECPA